MKGQAADGADPLPHEAVVVLDVADHVSVSVVDGNELVHRPTGAERAKIMYLRPGGQKSADSTDQANRLA